MTWGGICDPFHFLLKLWRIRQETIPTKAKCSFAEGKMILWVMLRRMEAVIKANLDPNDC